MTTLTTSQEPVVFYNFYINTPPTHDIKFLTTDIIALDRCHYFKVIYAFTTNNELLNNIVLGQRPATCDYINHVTAASRFQLLERCLDTEIVDTLIMATSTILKPGTVTDHFESNNSDKCIVLLKRFSRDKCTHILPRKSNVIPLMH